MKVLNDNSTSNIIKANEGTIIYKRFFSETEYIDTVTYKRQGIELFIYTKWDTSKFYRTDFNSVIKEAIECNASFNIDSTNFENLKVYYNPTAYISKFSDSEISFWCYTGKYFIHIKIPDFNGAGSYAINYSQAVLGRYDGDVIETFNSDSINTGSLIIDQFDEVNGKCKGRFNFTAKSYDRYSNNQVIHIISDAEFSVPIYK